MAATLSIFPPLLLAKVGSEPRASASTSTKAARRILHMSGSMPNRASDRPARPSEFANAH